jgi:hypothetical protein
MIAADRLREFNSLTLDQLDASANLLTRVDRKYIVEAHHVAALLDEHHGALRVLEIDGDRSFRYTSTYFDTPRLDLHRWAATGRSHRAKVRVRVCESSLGPTAVMLEVKTKDGRGATVKRRQQHPIDRCDELGPTGMAFVDEATGRPGLGGSLVPVLTTSYWRSTFVDPAAGTRATIDTGLECRHVSGRSVALPKAIVETKSRLAPSDLDRWMWRNGNRPERISKYCTAMSLIDPALPGNRWNRTVNRHFDMSGTNPVGR